MGLKRALAAVFLTVFTAVDMVRLPISRLRRGSVFESRRWTPGALRLIVGLAVLVGTSTCSAVVPGAAGVGLAGASPQASNLYVANYGAESGVSTVTSYPTSSNGDVSPTATVASPRSMDEPYGLAFDHSGDLWVANASNNTIVEFTPGQLATSATPTPAVTLWSTPSGSLLGPVALAFDSAGNLWVANENDASVAEFTPGQLATSGAPTPAVELSPSGLAAPDALAFDPAGNLWVADSTSNALIELTPAQLTTPGASSPTPAVTLTSTAAGSLDGPAALAFDSSGDLWVAGYNNSAVAEFTPAQLSAPGSSSPAPAVTLTSTATGGVGGPRSLAFDGSGDLWVANVDEATLDSTVAEFTPGQLAAPGSSSPTPAVTLTSTSAGSLDGPSLTLASSGDLWVANFGNDTLAEFTPGQLATPGSSSPTPTVTLGSTGAGLDGTIGMTSDSSGHLWAANRNNNTVAEFTAGPPAAGTQAAAVTLSSTATGSLDQPAGIAFDSSGDLWVANEGGGSSSSSLVEFTPGQLASGSPTPTVTITSRAGNVAGGSLDAPDALAFDASGDLWVANLMNSTVVEYTPNELGQSGSPAPAVDITQQSGVAGPLALTFGPGGDLWVANSIFDNVVGFAPAELAAASPAPTFTVTSSAFDGVQGMAFDPSGNLWLSNSSGNSVVELDSGELGSSGPVTPAATISGASTGLDGPTGIVIAAIPAAPDGLSAAAGNAQVTLSWGAVTGASSYAVFDATGPGGEDYSAPPSCTTTTTTCTVASLTNGTDYYFTVEALGPAGTSAPSGEVTAVPRASNLYVANVGQGDFPSTVTSYPTNATGDVTPTATVSSPASGDGPDGVAFDHSGDLWVANYVADTVVEFTPGELASSASPTPAVTLTWTTAGSLDGPAGLAFDSAGDLWVADYNNGSVVEFTPGQLTSSGSPTPAVTLSPSGLASPDALAFDSAGNLWVADYSSNTVLELTPSQLSRPGPSSPTPAVTLTSAANTLDGPAALAFDSAGNLWVAGYNNGSVVELTPGQFARSGSPTPAAVLFPSGEVAPEGLAFDSAGDLWVTDSSSSTVAELTPDQLSASGAPSPGVVLSANGLIIPYALAFDPAGDLWVTDYSSNTVVELTPDQLSASGSPSPDVTLAPTTAGLDGTKGVAFDASGDLWAANFYAGTLSEFTPGELSSGPQTPALTLSSTPAGSLNFPSALAFDSKGDLWVANYGNGANSTLVEFTPAQLASGSPTPAVTLSSADASITLPVALAFDSSGDLWVANDNGTNGTVVEFTPDELGQSGSPAPAVQLTQSSAIAGPSALAFGPAGDLWVASGTNDTVLGFSPSALSSTTPLPTVALTSAGFDTPDGMAFDPSGNLWLSNSGTNSVVELDSGQLTTTHAVTPAATISGTGTGLDGPAGIAIAAASTAAPGNPAPGPAPSTTTTNPPTTTSVPGAGSTTTTGSVPAIPSATATTTSVPLSGGATRPTAPTSSTTTTPTPAGFPGAQVSHPNGAIVDFGSTVYVFAGGRAFAASAGELRALEKIDRAKIVAAVPGAGPSTTVAPRAGTLITTRAVNGNPTVFVAGTSGDLYGFATAAQFRAGGFDPDLIVTVPSLVGLKVSRKSAGAAGINALSTGADGGIVDSNGTFYVFAGGKAFRIPKPSALSALEKADTAKLLRGSVTLAQTSAPIAGGTLLSVVGENGVFVTYDGGAYPFKTMAQLHADGYGGTATVPVPSTDDLAAPSQPA